MTGPCFLEISPRIARKVRARRILTVVPASGRQESHFTTSSPASSRSPDPVTVGGEEGSPLLEVSSRYGTAPAPADLGRRPRIHAKEHSCLSRAETYPPKALERRACFFSEIPIDSYYWHGLTLQGLALGIRSGGRQKRQPSR
jgi:hypothetical protein